MTYFAKFFILLGCYLIVPVALAHEVRPSYLEVVEIEATKYQITWKQPVSPRGKLAISPEFPENCEISEKQIRLVGSAIIEKYALNCNLNNQTIKIHGLDRTLTDVFVRFEKIDGTIQTEVLKPSSKMMILGAENSDGIISYLTLGIQHILTGWDHLLFVFALLLLVRPAKIIAYVTAFTVAHSITLGLSALGHFSLPSAAVEITVAFSITLMGLEILRQAKGETSLTAKLGWPVTFIIGLIHGFGFAGALIEIGLPEKAKLLALLFFNLGVEIGQLAVVVVILVTGWVVTHLRSDYVLPIKIAGAYCAGIAGAYWAIDRIWAMLVI